MTDNVKVASRAVRRGRRYRSRRPPAPASQHNEASTFASDFDEAADSLPSPETPKYYSRPPAPVMAFEPIEDDEAWAETNDDDGASPDPLAAPDTLRGVGSVDREAVPAEVAIIAAQDEEPGLDSSFFNTESFYSLLLLS